MALMVVGGHKSRQERIILAQRYTFLKVFRGLPSKSSELVQTYFASLSRLGVFGGRERKSRPYLQRPERKSYGETSSIL